MILEIPIYESLHDFPADGSVFLAFFQPEFGIWNGGRGDWQAQTLFQYKGGLFINDGLIRVFTDAQRDEKKVVNEEIPAGWAWIE